MSLPRPLFVLLPLLLVACGPLRDAPAASNDGDAARARLLARADSLELPGEWTPPPGDALEHHTAGFAKTLCSAVFITGLDPADGAENVGYFTGPYEERAHVVDTVVDRATRTVRLTLPSGVVRTAKHYGSQGCVAHSVGEDSVHFTPSVVRPNLPVLFMSGYAEEQLRNQIDIADMHFIAKPFSVQQIGDKVGDVLAAERVQ
ncbi:MAG: hypothetical protein KY453_07695 [Gemmatimonadetes bacterium]|nr:hypothetical protein [Gemmatimonadota bacterium]